MLKKKFKDDWNFFLSNMLDGRTISANMNKTTYKGVYTGINTWKNYTVTVKEWDINEEYGSIDILGEDGERYILPVDDKKIYIENAS
jgi:hypothetical protein